MNLVNTIKTLLLGSGVLVLVLPPLINWLLAWLGCGGDDPLTADIVEVTFCTGGGVIDIPVALQKFVGGLMAAGIVILTGLFKGGTFKQNFFNKSVPVVEEKDIKPGTETKVVTPEQVATP